MSTKSSDIENPENMTMQVNPIRKPPVSGVLGSLPTVAAIEADIARCDEEKKRLKALLKVVKGK